MFLSRSALRAASRCPSVEDSRMSGPAGGCVGGLGWRGMWCGGVGWGGMQDVRALGKTVKGGWIWLHPCT